MLRDVDAVPVMMGIGEAAPPGGTETHLVRAAGPAFLGYAPALAEVLDTARIDLLHLHGIWQYPSWAATRWAARTGRPYLISPHGMLDPWITNRHRWRKRLARTGWERRSWSKAAAFHALTAAEAGDIAREAGPARVATIPNCAPPVAPPPQQERAPMLLYLGRVHPKKNLPALVAGWSAAYPHLPAHARLVIAGWGAEADIAKLKALVNAAPGSRFIGAALGSAKTELLSQARFLALPSLSEGLPMAVLEAWAHGTPTLISTACHLPEGFATGAALDCGTDADAVAACIRTAFALPRDAWLTRSHAARELAATRFGRAEVAEAWASTYAELLDRPG